MQSVVGVDGQQAGDRPAVLAGHEEAQRSVDGALPVARAKLPPVP